MKDNELDHMGTTSPGNASNPPVEGRGKVPEQSESLLAQKAETYLREGGAIEDLPDAREQQEAEAEIKKP